MTMRAESRVPAAETGRRAMASAAAAALAVIAFLCLAVQIVSTAFDDYLRST